MRLKFMPASTMSCQGIEVQFCLGETKNDVASQGNGGTAFFEGKVLLCLARGKGAHVLFRRKNGMF